MAEGDAELADIKAHIADHASLVAEIDETYAKTVADYEADNKPTEAAVAAAEGEAVKEDIEAVFKWLEVRNAFRVASPYAAALPALPRLRRPQSAHAVPPARPDSRRL